MALTFPYRYTHGLDHSFAGQELDHVNAILTLLDGVCGQHLGIMLLRRLAGRFIQGLRKRNCRHRQGQHHCKIIWNIHRFIESPGLSLFEFLPGPF